MEWKDLKGVVAKFAPLVGSSLGGPGGAIVGGLISKALSTDNNPDAVAEAISSGKIISGNMDAVKAIKKLELDHETDLIRLQLEEARVITADRQHAREQHKDHWMPPVLTIVLAVMVSLMCAGMFYLQMPEDNTDIIYMIAGQLLTAFLTCVAFWMGSSRGSQEKNRLMKKE